MNMVAPDIDDIVAAHARISPHIDKTPVLDNDFLNSKFGCELFFKCENMQKVGAFKARGASNAIFSLDDEQSSGGVATHSSGNHGAALSMAATKRGIAAHVVMPSNAPESKKDSVARFGGLIIECEPTLASREQTLERVVAQTGAHVVHPYHDARVIAGQGTVAIEVLEQVADLDAILVPVGGGGLLAGVATAVKSINPKIEVIGVEPAGADDAFRSFGLGRLIAQTSPETIADGLRSSLGKLNFGIIQQYVDTILTVEEASIIEAMRLQWTHLKSVVEPSGAVSFAAILEYEKRFAGRRVAVVISGGNLDFDKLPW
jgi:threonine dehydratase